MTAETDHLKEHGYVLIKNFMSPDMIELCKSFLDLSVVSGLRKPETNPYLTGDVEQILPNIFVDSILLAYMNRIESLFETEMIPSYIFLREYLKGSELLTHRDRPQCEFSATILIDKQGEGNTSLFFCDDEQKTNSVEVNMEEGDAIVFSGASDFDGKWHYRPKLEQKSIVTAFLHYVSPENEPNNIFPRPHYRSN
jgi:hypothetical protein